VLPPENIIRKIRVNPADGHRMKSTEANPVQVIIEIIWK
jgi:hypothetical protein